MNGDDYLQTSTTVNKASGMTGGYCLPKKTFYAELKIVSATHPSSKLFMYKPD